MGRGGVYFRQTFPSPEGTRTPITPSTQQSAGIEFKEIESGNVSQMVDSSSSALLDEINSKKKRPLTWPWVLGISVALLATLAAVSTPFWTFCLLAPLCVCGLAWAIYADKLRKTVVLFYELEPHIEEAYQNLHDAFDLLRGCSKIWHIDSRGDIRTAYDRKVNAGADALVRRKGIFLRIDAPAFFKCNISIPVLPAGRQRLYLLPDRILVWDTDGVGAVAFDQVDINLGERHFIESDSVPGDARVVDRTWRYVNKKGGPDKRFKNNREIPIVLYEEMLLTSKTGLQEQFQLSRAGMGVQFDAAVKRMAAAISERGVPQTGYNIRLYQMPLQQLRCVHRVPGAWSGTNRCLPPLWR